ncbi:MAG: Trm112 family protein [Gammaproteobacteria bacterium]|nr:Trm112 family protein [Gammaproteobacteria bacterium]MDP2141358.1 Trm112 family protein [Gammaproteobacteria bacterium]MDP2349055.1 Trm112 family protein [Gammaproteobacteria bacterium]
MDQKLLTILACPICKGPLKHDRTAAELICFGDAVAFPIRDGIPVMLESEARALTAEEREKR